MSICHQEGPCLSGGNRREPRRQPLLYHRGCSQDKPLGLPVWLGEPACLLQHGAMQWEEASPYPISGPSQAGSEAGGEETATNPGHIPWSRSLLLPWADWACFPPASYFSALVSSPGLPQLATGHTNLTLAAQRWQHIQPGK